ncbi:N-acetylglucosamine-1-phosphodiester alpha-N-acetylglucosaminidase [Tachyglossus aculeatus]|uniref:N-acetylglucosamine-1-phosphodiester alpha-N-acetylglucosaminidase n=1 Tax=Tachyglossus aculeatus TaxID=9261 RepID=UPI0018F6FE0B|nr:N-acetylglucosamine-1-phosphodiester alpha-N-acetylglucosaminidase [Tachyglossus aculeatus]
MNYISRQALRAPPDQHRPRGREPKWTTTPGKAAGSDVTQPPAGPARAERAEVTSSRRTPGPARSLSRDSLGAAGARGGGHVPSPQVTRGPDMAAVVLSALLGCLLAVAAAGRTSLDDDLLLPYPRARARPPRTDRPVPAGPGPRETWPPAPAGRAPGPPLVRSFVSYFPAGGGGPARPVSGHLTVAAAPLRSFSVLEPGGPGGCAAARRRTVEETARAARCLVAQNGGFFRPETGECLGNLVSDGRRVRAAGGPQNAQFGIRRDGTLVTGYLTEEEMLDEENPFVQLVSGVVWLLRAGRSYVNESLEVECDKTQETGTFAKFASVVSARTALGHDEEGRLVLFHADGQTDRRGINLWEMAEFLKEQGVVNAINLDGGGSATFVVNGTLANYPSDHCREDSMWRCPRSVSTVVCVHEPRCQPPDCSGHGHCVQGACRCTGAFWAGPSCNVLDCGPANCSLHGLCSDAGCLCDAGWTGSNCSEACAPGSFGNGCTQQCWCQNGATCDPVHGTCSCPAGFHGDACAQACPLGWYGPNCQQPCECENTCPCDPETGSCNLTRSPAIHELLSRAGQCLAPSLRRDDPHITEAAWLALTVALALLLAVSVAINVKLALGPRTPSPRCPDRRYAYVPLQETNGEVPPPPPEKEPPGETQEPSQPEMVALL